MSDNKLLELSFEFAVAVVNLADSIKTPKSSYMIDQFARAGTSVGANIHEAQYAHSKVVSETWDKSVAFRNLDLFTKGVLLEYVNSINLNIYRHWLADGKRVPKEKLVELSNALTCDGLYGVLK